MTTSILVEEPVITARGLTKRYGAVDALRGIDVEVRRGEVVALLGPNGAGKTTVLEILEGFAEPSAGEVKVLGCDPSHAGRALRERIGVVLQESQPEPGLTVLESIELYAGYYAAPRDVGETIALVGLTSEAGRLGEQLSGGQQRRLDVALGLIGDPELLFLDEPTTGFDPSARRSAWRMVEGLKALGRTIVLTTHYMEEAERLADRIVVLADGRVVADAAPGMLGGRDHAAATIRFTLPSGQATRPLPLGVQPADVARDGTVTVCTERPLQAVHELAEWALPQGLELRDLEVRRPVLEDVYLALTDGGR